MTSRSAELELYGFQATSRAHVVNEDLAYIGTNMAWLLDGATPMGSDPQIDSVSDARWYVNWISSMLRSYEHNLTVDLVTLMSKVVELARDEIAIKKPRWPHSPSAAVAVVRVSGHTLEYFRLADVTVAMISNSMTRISHDEVSKQREDFLVRLERSEGSDALRQSVLKRRRTQMNCPGGYWVLADEPQAVSHGEYQRLDINVDNRVVLASDGLTRAVETFGLCTWDEFASLDDRSANDLLVRLRAAEREDSDRVRFPRISVHDDATGVWLGLHASSSSA